MSFTKSLMLGSAAVLATVVGAQAADLPSKKAAPATYVKICDAYGAGFFFIPGTETCVKVGGYVRVDYDYRPERKNTVSSTANTAGKDNTTSGFYNRGTVQIDARTGQVDHSGIFINLKGKPEHERREAQGWSTLLHGFHVADAVTGACVLLARATWDKLGGFDEGFRNGGEDVDLCFRAQQAGLLKAVADRSVIRHHVSSSPGRALRNEENSRRLTLRWRRELVDCAARHWCRHYYELSPLEPGTHGHGFQFGVWLHTIGLRRDPPPATLAAMRRIIDAAVDVELARWTELLGPVIS